MRKGIFRQSALDKISSLDQLDVAMTVVSPAEYIASIAMGIILVAILIWSIFGSVPNRIDGNGIFIDVSTLSSVKAPNQGLLKDVFVEQGDYVKKGQVIARIERQDLLDQINIYNHRLDELLRVRDKINIDTKNGVSKQATLRALYEQGLITESEYINSRQPEANITQQINDMQQQIIVSNETYQTSTQIISNANGYVKEIPVRRGDFIQPGTPIAVLGQSNESNVMHALVYFPARQAKKVHTGMKVGIMPSTIKQEEYGYIEGIVTNISTFPVSDQYLMSTLQNSTLVQNFRKIDNPIEIEVSLIPNPDTYSGYKWSSSKGPDEKLTVGVICTGTITVDSKRPIELVIPALKKKFLGIGDNGNAQ